MPKCPRCHIPTKRLWQLPRWRGTRRVCENCYKILLEDRNARAESYVLAKVTKKVYSQRINIIAAAKILGFVPKNRKTVFDNSRSPQTYGSFEERIGEENIPYFYEMMHENWRALVKIYFEDEEKRIELNRALESIKIWCTKRGLR